MIEPEPCTRDFYMFNITVLETDFNTSSMSLSLIIAFAFELNVLYIVFYHHFVFFLNSSVFTNYNLLLQTINL